MDTQSGPRDPWDGLGDPVTWGDKPYQERKAGFRDAAVSRLGGMQNTGLHDGGAKHKYTLADQRADTLDEGSVIRGRSAS